MDAKLQSVLLDHGLEGYGLYWYCIELIASEVESDNLTFELEHDARIIARNTGSTVDTVNRIMSKFIDLGLFEIESNIITCLKLSQVADDYTSKFIRKMPQVTDNKQIRQSPTKSDKNNTEETILNNIRQDNNITNKRDSRFSEFWDLYGKKVDSKKCESKFKKLNDVEVDAIFSKLPDYIKSTPDKKYRKNPLTWLNGKCWNDEVQFTGNGIAINTSQITYESGDM